MKFLRLFTLVFVGAFAYFSASSQNVSINIQTQNSGIVKIGESIFLEVWINNIDADSSIPVYKLRPQISIPSKIVSIADIGHILPNGWAIVSNKNGIIRFTNGTDIIDPGDVRTLYISFKGIDTGGPFTVLGSLAFSNGIAPGSASGTPTKNDNPTDNSSTTTFITIR